MQGATEGRDEAQRSLDAASAAVEAAARELAGAEAGDGRDESNRSLQERLADTQRARVISIQSMRPFPADAVYEKPTMQAFLSGVIFAGRHAAGAGDSQGANPVYEATTMHASLSGSSLIAETRPATPIITSVGFYADQPSA